MAFHLRWCLAIFVVLVAVACGRTTIEFGNPEDFMDEPDAAVEEDGAVIVPEDDTGAPIVDPPPPPVTQSCEPSEEVCNGRDDDCDGEVDEIPPVPCPGGGARYCVAGRLSECPTRCEACMPGTTRICLLSYCEYWGSQTCAADGRAWGPCHEVTAPPTCRQVARQEKYSAELEQCALDEGYCVVDDFDLDGDGDRKEMLGQCEEVECR